MTLVSPGVSVSVIDESISVGAGEGTVPFILISTAQDKSTPDGTGSAEGTTKANANKLYLMTSQRELLQTFGDPGFLSIGGSAIHGSPLNEYGLLAAHSYLGLANRAYIIRADIDLAQLEATVLEPTSPMPVGTMWIDSSLTQFGLQVVTEIDGTTPTWSPAEISHVVSGAGTLPDPSTLEVGEYGVLFSPLGIITYYVVEGAIQALAKVGVTNGAVDTVATILVVGSGYESIPDVVIGAPDGTGSTTTAVIASGAVVSFTIDGSGGGYTVVPTVTIGAPDGVAATADATSTGGAISLVDNIVSAAGYTSVPVVTFSAPNPTVASTSSLFVGDAAGIGTVAVDDGGTGYLDSAPPVVTQSGGTGTGGTFTATVVSGIVTDIAGSGGGTGYVGDEAFTIAAASEVQATGTSVLLDGEVTSITIDIAGEGYASATVTVAAPIAIQAIATAVLTDGAVTSISVGTPGSGYATAPTSTLNVPTMTQATAVATLTGDTVNIILTSGGSGYATAPTLTIDAPTAVFSWEVLSDNTDFQFASVEPSTRADGTTPLLPGNTYVRTVPTASGALYVISVRSAETGQYVIRSAPLLADDATADDFYGGTLSAGDLYLDTHDSGQSSIVLNMYDGTMWNALLGTDYEVSPVEPRQGPSDGALWYNPDVGTDGQGNTTVDMLVNNGTGSWEALNMPGYPSAGSTLYLQSADPKTTGATLLDGDVWVDTDQINAYPTINRYRLSTVSWELVDNSNQTSNAGIVFADARPVPDYVSSVTNVGDYNGGGADLDIDAPDPAAYPKGMLLWNSRYSTRNVKEWSDPYLVGETAAGDPVWEGRWVSSSGNNDDGSLKAGRDAQKSTVIAAMQAVLLGNDDLRSEFIFYNLIANPGFPETIDEMVSLNIDRKETGFVIADTPFTLTPDATSLLAWASNQNNASGNGDDGLISADPYLGVYYPSGLSTNIDGTDVVVPPSHMMLRTMVFNDQVAYPWFAPAGLTRGRINNASSVGYVTSEGEFQPVTLNQGQRDTLYTNNVNPIAFIPNEGLVAFGQKTRNPFDSALSRINVARLVNYIRYQAEALARPFLFEPNDSQTRDNVKDAYDRFLAELVTLRGLSDFLVVCDLSNNTPVRIDKNELWIDMAIVPIKAIEFIYIPIRIKNTGADLSANIGG